MYPPWQAILTVLIVGLASGCWKDDLAQIPADALSFRADAGSPPNWLVLPIESPLECPDGEKSRFYFLFPEDSDPATAMPGAVLYHSGSFDFVYTPDAASPLDGVHFADPNRLTSVWAFEQVFSTLGMHPGVAPSEVHDGSLPARLAEEGVAMLLPANCWGDLWAARRGVADNDFGADFFYREGRAASEWGFRVLADPAFALALDIELPVAIDPTRVFAVGLGEGGRAVMELLSIDNDEDGEPDYEVAGALVDSPPDDLRVFYQSPGQYPEVLLGLQRIFQEGQPATTTGSVFGASRLPNPFLYVYSSTDSVLPPQIHAAALSRMEGREGVVSLDAGVDEHVILNRAGQAGLRDEAVTALVSGR